MPPSSIAVAALTENIFIIHGHRVMLDADLAKLYGVTTKRLNEQVRRNLKRFPDRFMFQLTEEEAEALRSQIATLKGGRGQHRKYRPYVFTEHGAIMLASVLNSPQAIRASVLVVDAFVRLREVLFANREFALKLRELEERLSSHDEALIDIVKHLRQLTEEPEAPQNPMGF